MIREVRRLWILAGVGRGVVRPKQESVLSLKGWAERRGSTPGGGQSLIRESWRCECALEIRRPAKDSL